MQNGKMIRINILEEIIKGIRLSDFNLYRTHYDSLTHNDIKDICKVIVTLWPMQRQVKYKEYIKFFKSLDRELNVCELGGYDGFLAKQILTIYPDIHWHNTDIISHVPVDGLDGYNYTELVLGAPFYMYGWKSFDVFVSSDTIEHFANEEVDKILSRVNGIKYLMMEIDIPEHGTDWKDNVSTHVCTYGWEDIDRQLDNYKIIADLSDRTWFKFLELIE